MHVTGEKLEVFPEVRDVSDDGTAPSLKKKKRLESRRKGLLKF